MDWPFCFVKVTIESPDLEFVYGDSDRYDAEIAGLLYIYKYFFYCCPYHICN